MSHLPRDGSRLSRALAIAMVVAALANGAVRAQGPAGVDPSLLDRLRAYAARYTDTMSTVVAHEHYVQSFTTRRAAPQSRVLRADVLSLRLASSPEPVWFRDVYEVDGRTVRDREQRLLRLLESKAPGTLDELHRIAAEGARFNLGRVPRTTNVPDLVFAYVAAAVGHVRFTPAKDATIRGQRVAVLRFEEVGTPSIVRGRAGRDIPARGRVWVEPATGVLVRSEVSLGDSYSTTTTTVDFVAHPRVPVRVPDRMEESYRSPTELGAGTATYTDVRVFGVATSEQIRKPPPDPR